MFDREFEQKQMKEAELEPENFFRTNLIRFLIRDGFRETEDANEGVL